MRRLIASVLLGAALLAASSADAAVRQEGGASAGPALIVRGRLVPPEGRPSWKVADLGGGRRELVLVEADGRVLQWRAAPGAAPALTGELRLPEPLRSLVAFDPPEGDVPAQLVVVDPGGARVFPVGADGLLAAAGRVVAPRARFTLRTGTPLFAGFRQDVDGDGLRDLVLPAGEDLAVWLRRTPDAAGAEEEADGDSTAAPAAVAESYRLAARVAANASLDQSAQAEALTDRLEEHLTIPALEARDVDGDGRADLIVEDGGRRGFHLYHAESGYGREPDVVLDLSIFRDTTPKPELRPGRILVGDDDASVQSEDLDGDGIPDYVIAQGRKVWVFRGTKQGPRFDQPVQILKSAEDVTFLLLLDLDDDGTADLLIGKLVVPSVPSLLLGLVAGVDIDLSLAGYPSRGAEGFATTPRWHRDLVLQLPALLELLRRPQELVGRFQEAASKFRIEAKADLDGDGHLDAALVDEKGGELEVWKGAGELDTGEEDAARRLRHLLLEDEDRTWDLDRALSLLSETGQRRTARITGSRPADLSLPLEIPEGFTVTDARTTDVDGDGREEVLLALEKEGEVRFELIALRP